MLFNSLEFIFAFLPVTILVYTLLRINDWQLLAKCFLVAASLFFYGWWNVKYIPLIVASISINYVISLGFNRDKRTAKIFLVLGIIFNLCLLGYFKYFNFFMENAAPLLGFRHQFQHIALPLAISFFTFQQISYLVEAYRDGKAAESFLDYSLFVLFFPHLIAGPITHHKEMLPQFKEAGHGRLDPGYVSVGTAIFIMGLAKKVLLADTLATFADPVFKAFDAGQILSPTFAWTGALAYTFQLYFDFSGYSDMALGLGLLFGIKLPVNFASPYKSSNIIEFWGRWHITLSRFLRNYLYIPLGGNRHGKIRRFINLLITMLIGGLWHGAGWNFVAWGGLHGAYLIINHAKQQLFGINTSRPFVIVSWAVTFLSIVVAWVLFRATTWHGALGMLNAMWLHTAQAAPFTGFAKLPALATIALSAALAFFTPNTLELVGYPDCLPSEFEEKAPLQPLHFHWLGAPVLLGLISAFIIAKLPDPGIFLYFNF